MSDIHNYLQEHGYSHLPPVFYFDGRIHRWSADEKPEKDEWYIGFEGISAKGNPYKYLMASSWSSHKLNKVEYRSWTQSHEDYDEIEGYLQQMRVAIDKAREQDKKDAADKSLLIWNKSSPTDIHPYLTNKRIKSHGLRVYEGRLVIPCGNPMSGLQYIFPNGSKCFMQGSFVAGNPFLLKGTVEIVGITESYANAATIFETLGITVYATFGASNMVSTARLALTAYPKSKFVIFADNDEAGLEAAKKCSSVIDCICFPPPNPGDDWNDAGPEVLQDMWDPKGATFFEQINTRFSLFLAQKEPKIIRFDPRDEHGYKLISPASFKAEMEIIHHPFLHKPADSWIKSPYAKRYERIVFNPKNDHSQRELNIWNPPSFKRNTGIDKLSLFEEFVFEIISDSNHEICNYIWNWLARLVQQPWNQINRTALVLMGAHEGTGKSKFGELVGLLFGRHFFKVTDIEQLLSRFGMFLVQGRVLVLIDESSWVSNSSYSSKLKNMITSTTLTGERKNEDAITMNNYANFIFCSNEDQPVSIGMHDRRFLATRLSTKRRKDFSFFQSLTNQIENEGGLEQLYNKLINMNVEDFWAQNKPENDVTFNIKMESADPIQQFVFELLSEGEFEGQSFDNFIPIPRTVLYESYVRSCRNIGKKPVFNTKFWPKFENMTGSSCCYPRTDGTRTKCELLLDVNTSRKVFEKFCGMSFILWQ